MKKRDLIILLLILAIFIVPRFLGVHQIYHQDEYRWATIADGTVSSIGPHPPLFSQVLKLAGSIVGFLNLRWVPFIFSFLNFILLYFVVKKSSGYKTAALIALGLFAVNIYSVVASLQIDIDGAVLPFFVLLGYYAYQSLYGGRKMVWWPIFIIAVVGGLLTKLSFALFLGTVLLDFSWSLFIQNRTEFKKTLRHVASAAIVLIILGGAFYFFYASRFHVIIDYAKHFKSLNFSSRAYLDLVYKIAKSLVWLSPLLLLPVIYGLFSKDVFNRNRFWYIYIAVNLIFYTVLFDFATLTIERYFMFLIIPSIIIASDVIYALIRRADFKRIYFKIAGAITLFVVFSFAILSSAHVILPLNPKIAYFQHVKSLNFNFLIPFSGGSGPIGFYFSSKFILFSWIVAIALLLGYVYFKKLREVSLIIFLVFGVGYNVLFLGEFLFGSFYGSPAKIARASADYVIQDKNIPGVITYNDIAAYDLLVNKKYISRFYTTPTRDYTQKLTEFRGYYLVVDFPLIDKSDRHWKLIKDCPMTNQFKDKETHSYIFNCTKIKR